MKNNKLVMYDLTAVNCTYNYTHSGKVSKLCNMHNNNVAASICAQSYAFCVALPMASQVTPMTVLVPSGIQSVLLTPYQAHNNHGTIGRLPSSTH